MAGVVTATDFRHSKGQQQVYQDQNHGAPAQQDGSCGYSYEHGGTHGKSDPRA
jgi:hypothetical protein